MDVECTDLPWRPGKWDGGRRKRKRRMEKVSGNHSKMKFRGEIMCVCKLV